MEFARVASLMGHEVSIATGYRAQADLIRGTHSVPYRIRVIGDASEARDALWVIYEGAKTAREI